MKSANKLVKPTYSINLFNLNFFKNKQSCNFNSRIVRKYNFSPIFQVKSNYFKWLNNNKKFSTSKELSNNPVNPYTVVVDELMKNLRGDFKSPHFNAANFKHILSQMEKCDFPPLEDELEEIIVKTAKTDEIDFFNKMNLTDLIQVFALFKYLSFRNLSKNNETKLYLEKLILEKLAFEQFFDKVSDFSIKSLIKIVSSINILNYNTGGIQFHTLLTNILDSFEKNFNKINLEFKLMMCIEVLFDNTHHIYENFDVLNFKNKHSELSKSIFSNHNNLVLLLHKEVTSNLENVSISNVLQVLLNQLYPKLTSDCILHNNSVLSDKEKHDLLYNCFNFVNKKLRNSELNDNYISLFSNLCNYNKHDYDLFQLIMKKVVMMTSTFSPKVLKDFFFLGLRCTDKRLLTDVSNKNSFKVLKSYILNTDIAKEENLNGKEVWGVVNKLQLKKIHNAFFKLSKQENGNIDASFKRILLKCLESSAIHGINYEKELGIIYYNYMQLGLNK